MLVLPGLAAYAIFCIITGGDEFTHASIITMVPTDFTFPTGIAAFITDY